ncbi:RHS repeat-associated core domain-containing protein [Pseudomonas violetae]|jgi:RHS repeat-associated protein|uniref:RHS repeat-associated core domain-containing protein n=1 Tax=Pseudomonas violetae TaxID=2915813 RepID=A0ABT0EZQ6_9PSED|nr:RHS repeat-associated core domain-containing protein [Pseudomonas violetae]MCK1791248.1 RHS repeat-associated core domain-containing protein [Pseudomonas violetae]
MPTSPLQTVLCRYHYDALDRSITWTPDRQAHLQRFYCQNRLTTEIQNAEKRSIFQHDDQVLAQHNHLGPKVETTLLATDQQRSVLNALNSLLPHNIAYLPYGHRPFSQGLLSLLGFNGEPPDRVTGHYHLGNGYRQYNPVLMRFNCPDKLSPFGEGGVNAYAYCGNDPINWSDPNGSMRWFGIIGKKSISSLKAANLADEMQAPNKMPTVKYGDYIAKGDLKRTINLDKYTKNGQRKISDEFGRSIKKTSYILIGTIETISNPSSIANVSKLTPDNVSDFIKKSLSLHKKAAEMIEPNKYRPQDIRSRLIDQFEFMRDANSYYADLKKAIPNYDTAHIDIINQLRKRT